MPQKKALYLDIDGVILTRELKPADGLFIFLSYILEHFECFWLTTHCKGDTKPLIAYLSKLLDPFLIEMLQEIKATNWDTLKTEAIYFSRDFFWLDDQPFQSEKAVLQDYGKSDSLIVVDLKRPWELESIREILAKN